MPALNPSRVGLLLGLVVFALATLFVNLPTITARDNPAPPAQAKDVDRSPVDLLLTPDEKQLITVNQTSATISLVDVESGKVRCELPVGTKPSAVALTPDGKTALVSAWWSGELHFFTHEGDSLKDTGTLSLRFEPRGIAITPDGKTAYVALSASGEVAVVDIASRKLTGKIAVGRWPRYLAMTPDGKSLAVGLSGEGGLGVVDLAEKKLKFANDFIGLNFGHMQISGDGKHVYAPWIVYRANPITRFNIQLGWVLASRVARMRMEENVRREAISLDPPGKAIADPHGLALSPDEKTLIMTASGTHELIVMKNENLPWIDYGGSDHLDENLREDKSRFDRIDLGGRPMAVRYSRDGRRAFVANYLSNDVQVVDVPARKIERSIKLGSAKEESLVRKGEAIFHDGTRSLDQWYSCFSCHYEGHTNAVTMDTRNDGSNGTFKTVLSLRNVSKTAPYMWHGWQKDLPFAARKSMTESMLGPEPSRADVEALVAYLGTISSPPNSYRNADGSLTEAQKRGESVFRNTRANCSKCHNGEQFTDNRIHDVKTGARNDVYKGYNTPSLIGVGDRIRWLHDGRAKTLEDVLTGVHAPERVTENGPLTPEERADLIEYLKAL